uniref:Uncharacterized protein n=1 Tax=Anguilla anguilla TaxID=7936 RepID=A0A0E9XU56_ANGAN
MYLLMYECMYTKYFFFSLNKYSIRDVHFTVDLFLHFLQVWILNLFRWFQKFRKHNSYMDFGTATLLGFFQFYGHMYTTRLA